MRNAQYRGTKAYTRAEWFAQGHGRAYIGYSESLSQFTPAQLEKVRFKLMPWSDNLWGNKRPLFYSDVIGVNARWSNKQHLAIVLANLMASTKVICESFGCFQGQDPQYLMPVRHSVFKELGKWYPVYKELYDKVQATRPQLMNMGVDVRKNIPIVDNVFKSILNECLTEQEEKDEGVQPDAGEISSQ